ncbi:AT-hook motif nuclear-localized protein 1 [Magnolia sinica]|uniref:AT-hook motif nuclear-localized protein 1 n=1 Tax=Magnolia sinica TaxID=86752 RepID=UPI00265B34E1|nr:AT-hook motif nuclear-localized protein 1 [Magnolia sinica]
MEGREGMGSGMPAEASGSFHTVVKVEDSGQGEAAAAAGAPAAVSLSLAEGRKKRGRPRKYGPDGSVSLALSPMPISASAPTGEFSAVKRGRGRPVGSVNRPKQFNLDSGEWAGSSVGADFMPHVITVAAGEDVTMKIISFSQQGPRAICILSANGAISNVTLRQPDSSGGTLTYEGRFEILSLSGSFMPTESGGTRSRSGGMSVSLASPDGRVVGGGVAGLLVAASPVQVVVGSFMPNIQREQKPKKPKTESTSAATPTAAVPISSTDMDESYGRPEQRSSTIPKPNLTASSSFRGDSWASLHSLPDSRNTTDINISLPGG